MILSIHYRIDILHILEQTCSQDICHIDFYGIPLTGLTLPHLCAYPKLWSGFPALYAEVLFYVQWSERWDGCSFCWYRWNCWPSLYDLIWCEYCNLIGWSAWRKKWLLDNLGWYCDVTNIFIRQCQIQIATWNNRNQNRGIIKFCCKN